tara:strand:- start:56 stop:559 length:504 start_codon:yes stop_codon:yes gene_type:complete
MISEDEVIWAIRTFTSLRIGGRWHVNGVGVYERTGVDELTLVEIHQGKPKILDYNEMSLFESHDHLQLLAEELGWKMIQSVEKAWDYDGKLMNIPDELIGRAAVCDADCGVIVRVEPAESGTVHALIEDGICPYCNEKGFTKKWNDVWVVVDDTGARLKMAKKQEEE